MLHCRQHGSTKDSAAARPEKLEALAAAALLGINKAPTSADPPPDGRQQPAEVADNFRPFTVPQIQRADSLLGSLQAVLHAEQQNSNWVGHHAMVHACT